MLTFDRNVRVKNKVRRKEHLQSAYGEKISYGTIVQLCVACNKRQHSAKKYRGMAKVTSRRACKGFSINTTWILTGGGPQSCLKTVLIRLLSTETMHQIFGSTHRLQIANIELLW